MISIIKARQILGKKFERLSDKEIQSIIDMFYSLSNRVIENYLKNKLASSNN